MQILGVTIPIYLAIATGYLAVRAGLFAKTEVRVLARLVLQFCLPALLFQALAQSRPREVLDASFLVAYAVGSAAVLVGATLIARHRGAPLTLAALQGLGMSASNSSFIGYPILLQLFGPAAAGAALAPAFLVENLLVIPLALVLADAGGGAAGHWRVVLAESLRALLRNPLIIAIAAGFAVALLELSLPQPILRTVQLFAAGSAPVALFAIGGALVGLKLEGLRGSIAAIAFGKLVLHPLAVMVLLALLPPLPPTLFTAAMALACMPMISIYPLLAHKHGHEGLCAAALLATTLASFVTVNVALWLLRAGA